MKIDVLTLFPNMFNGVFDESIIKRALDNKIIEINIHNIRDYSKDSHKKVDDTPYGGGAGMAFMGMGMNAAGNVMGGFQQPVNQQPQQPQQQTQQQEDPYEKLAKLKKLLDDGVISQEEFDEAKKKLLGV